MVAPRPDTSSDVDFGVEDPRQNVSPISGRGRVQLVDEVLEFGVHGAEFDAESVTTLVAYHAARGVTDRSRQDHEVHRHPALAFHAGASGKKAPALRDIAQPAMVLLSPARQDQRDGKIQR